MIEITAKYPVNFKFKASGITKPNMGNRNMYESRDISIPVTNCVAVSIIDHDLVCILVLLV